MSTLVVKKVEMGNKADLKRFIRFNYELYKGNPYAVPDFYEDTIKTLSPKYNAAYQFSEAALYLAFRDGKVVGRVAAIINYRANKIWQKNQVRFGWIDFIDDVEVSAALINAVETWGKARGMETIAGPLGFTDMDPEGMLIEGFEEYGTMATIYNYPYYPQHLERLGFQKETDWVERLISVPPMGGSADVKYTRVAQISMRRLHLHIRKLKSKHEAIEGGYGRKIFNLINKAYSQLYGYSSMCDAQIDSYVEQYLAFADFGMIPLVENEDKELVAVGISIPSLSFALQKAKGKLFPFGWFHILRALKYKRSAYADLLLVAVDPAYQGKGVNALLFSDLIPVFAERGFKYAESHPQLETNHQTMSQWEYTENRIHKRRRCYVKPIDATQK